MTNSSPLNIVCAASNSYAAYCGIMLTSLFSNNTAHAIEVYVLSGDMSEENRTKFSQLATQFSQHITIIDIDKSQFSHLPIGERFSNISYEAYFRLLLPSLLPDCEKALYLDCDMIITTDVDELWNIDLHDMAMAAVADTPRMQQKSLARLGFAPTDTYFNSGMGLYNLKFLRDFHFEDKVRTFVDNHYDLIVYHDQDILNCVCHGMIREVAVEWNTVESVLEKHPQIHPFIIHYASLRKPWYKECLHPLQHEFWRYAALSPWHDLKPVFKYHGLKRFTKYYLKRLFN